MRQKQKKKKKATRDPNVPIAAWTTGDTRFEIRYTGPGECCTALYNPKHLWGGRTPSLIVTTHQAGNTIKDEELDPYNPVIWGWIVRLITDASLDRTRWRAITQTDEQLHGRVESEPNQHD